MKVQVPSRASGESSHDNLNSASALRTAGLAAAAIVGGVVALDLASQLTLWRKGTTEIASAADFDSRSADRRWLAIPGLGRQNGQFMAELARGHIPGVVDYASYSRHGISGKSVGKALANYYSRHYPESSQAQSRQNVLVHSMGFPTFFMGIEWCLKRGIAVPPIDTMMAFSSPMNAKHTFMENRVRMVARYPYPGGMLSKLGVEFYQRYEAEKFKLSALGNSALGALKVAYRDCPPALWSSQIRTIAGRENYHPNLFATVMTPETSVYHYGDEADKTVKVLSARKDLYDFIEAYGASLTIVNVPGDGHANMSGPKTRQHIDSLFAVAG